MKIFRVVQITEPHMQRKYAYSKNHRHFRLRLHDLDDSNFQISKFN